MRHTNRCGQGRTWAIATVVVPLIVTSGVALAGTRSSNQSAPSPQQVRSCDNRIELGSARTTLARKDDGRIGPVAFALVKLLKSRSYFTRVGKNGSIFGLKLPVFVQHDRQVIVAIASRSRSVASLFYAGGNFPKKVAGGVAVVQFDACPAGQPASTYPGTIGVATGFSGGILVARPACVYVEVWSPYASAPARGVLALGRSDC